MYCAMGDDLRSLQSVPQLADLLKVVFIEYCSILVYLKQHQYIRSFLLGAGLFK